jgi:uncharacterized protein
MPYLFIMLLAALTLTLTLTLPLSPSAQAANASFKCTAHSSKIEKLICTDNDLAQLDVSLASLYQVTMKSLSKADQSDLKAEQRDWLESRNACSKAANAKDCLKEEYHARINELKDR